VRASWRVQNVCWASSSHSRLAKKLSALDVDALALSREDFWPTFADLHRIPLLRSFERPWLFRVINVAAEVSPSVREREPLAHLAQQIRSLAMRMIRRGQELGVIRTDLDDDLLFAWLQAIDQASDRWLMEHWARLERAQVERISDQTVAAMSRAVAPEEPEHQHEP
jgi:hypothetical protein